MNTVSTGHTKQPLARPDALLLPFLAGRRWVNVEQIVRLESEGNYTVFFFADGSRLLMAATLKRLMARIPADQFVRLHRKHLVNRTFITAIRPDDFAVDLSNGDAVSIARRRVSTMKRETKVLKTDASGQ
jgi:two-component system, LytTR family, response regulator